MKSINLILLMFAVFTGLTSFASADIGGEGGSDMMGGMMSGAYGFGFMWAFGWLFMILVIVALVLLIIWLIKEITNSNKQKRSRR